ncbi:MAG TPA: protein phosphatase 2C domain-containing protein [Candidatus Syntrophosphaera sp.]|nr:protein phosphatase 2C domain-containing protein [Candidatus Syntrophosphaera sp.]HPH60173.1 protein phosphatase 2C domain-containing protein [Candidatus Syntrophosphaera sp.]
MSRHTADRFVISNLTDVGMVRESNQDYYGKYSGSFGELILVCDGMGGYSGGEVASQVAVETISAHFQSLGAEYNEINELHRSFSLAQQNIAHHASENPELAEMGTTAVALLIKDEQYWIAWIGDSRIYRRRGGNTEQLSKDHSWVQGMVDQGLIKAEDANDHPKKNIILRSLGAEPHASEAAGPFPLFRGDVFMLCSDGLSDYFPLPEVNRFLAQEPPQACRAMVDEAKRRGGKDNITIQVLKVAQGKAYKPTPPPGGINLLTLGLAVLALGLLLGGGINFLRLGREEKQQKETATTAVNDSIAIITRDTTRTGRDSLKAVDTDGVTPPGGTITPEAGKPGKDIPNPAKGTPPLPKKETKPSPRGH